MLSRRYMVLDVLGRERGVWRREESEDETSWVGKSRVKSIILRLIAHMYGLTLDHDFASWRWCEAV